MPLTSRLRALRVVHPFPSLLNAALVAALALVAGGTFPTAAVLAAGMLGLQFAIGAANDLHDAAVDALSKPWKPIPAGLVSAAQARVIASSAAVFSLMCAAAAGLPVAALALAMLACGLAYDFWLKPTVWAWACFSVAFAILPVYAWLGAVHAFPPRLEFVLPLAFISGPQIQLANALVDLERDRQAQVTTLATRLGRTRTLIVMAALLVAIHGLAWLTFAGASVESLVVVATGSALAAVGYALSTRQGISKRAAGWSMQAVSICVLGVGWLSAVS